MDGTVDVWSCREESIRVESECFEPKAGRYDWFGTICLGQVKLFELPLGPAIAIAQRIAAFLEIPVSQNGLEVAKTMGFRNEKIAPIHRIRALEAELERRDRKIAMLRAELEAVPEQRVKARAVPRSDRWTVVPERPYKDWWKLVPVPPGAVFVCGYVGGASWSTAIMMSLATCLLILIASFHQTGLTLNKETGTVTSWHRYLGFRWTGYSVSCRGQSIKVRSAMTVFLSNETLFWSFDKAYVRGLAKRMAAFLEIPYQESR